MESVAHKYFRHLTKGCSNNKEKLEIYKKEIIKISCFLFKENYKYKEDDFEISHFQGHFDMIISFFVYEEYNIEYISIDINEVLRFIRGIDEERYNCILALDMIFKFSGNIFSSCYNLEEDIKKYLKEGLIEISLKEKEKINNSLSYSEDKDNKKRRL